MKAKNPSFTHIYLKQLGKGSGVLSRMPQDKRSHLPAYDPMDRNDRCKHDLVLGTCALCLGMEQFGSVTKDETEEEY